VPSVDVRKFSSFVQDVDVFFSSTIDTEGFVDSGSRIAKYFIKIYFFEQMIQFILISFIAFGEFVLNIEEGITILEYEKYLFVKKFF
jgi:hypothetical protein